MSKEGKTGWDRYFYGMIRRDDDGNPVVRGKIRLGDGCIIATAKDQWILDYMLDEMVLLVLDEGLHSDAGATSEIAGTQYFHY